MMTALDIQRTAKRIAAAVEQHGPDALDMERFNAWRREAESAGINAPGVYCALDRLYSALRFAGVDLEWNAEGGAE